MSSSVRPVRDAARPSGRLDGALLLFALAVLNLGLSPARSQDGEDRSSLRPRRLSPAAPEQEGRPDRDRYRDAGGSLRGRRLAGDLPIRPGAEDAGPLRPGEEEELFVFAQRVFPADMVNAMHRLKARDPEEFRRVMELRAKQLRFVRRLFQVNPQLAQDLVDHAANMHAIRRAREFLRTRPEAPGRRQRAIRVIRERCETSVRLEVRILAERARMLEAARDEEAERAVQRLSAPDAELVAEPPEIREAVQALHNATEARELWQARTHLKVLLTARIDQEIQELRERGRRLRADGAAEVDRRVARALAGLAPLRRPPSEGTLPGESERDTPPSPEPSPRPPP